ncbi:hypothetical protein KDX27_40825 [Burkholderia cenocepacia]|uniref:hypothetical protein n=1 Tax=Burkholderia cenocepacia TaxID=95486 RepID=UPI001B9BAD54|nr:hypothetical protein [Burkholderia cenocepacia]MBR8030150.1 hypothetical protein [Burkholderia cenocepacia]MBR8174028.1 hypothetical protein [Burkholderia cenocepacia]
MNAAANAVLAIWNDFDRTMLHEYECWHTLEHVPERVWVPGMISGRRYRNVGQTEPRYLTLYDLENLDVLDRAEYADLVHNPTPWSARMRQSFLNFQRQPCELLSDIGTGTARMLSVFKTRSEESLSHSAIVDVSRSLLDQLSTAETGTVRVRVARVTERGPQAISNAGQAREGNEYLWMTESLEPALQPIGSKLDDLFVAWKLGFAVEYFGLYELLSQVDHSSVAAEARPSPKIQLMSQFTSGRS